MQSLVIDTSVRASRFAAQLATTMGGRYLALPRADAGRISSAISSAAQSVSARAGASTRSGAA
jgi:magnesium chelatase subunit D